MTIDRTTIDHLAHLARLALSGDERDRLAEDLGRIIAAVDTIAELDLRGVPPLLSVSGLESVFRADEPRRPLAREDVLRQAPATEGSGYLVPGVLCGGES